MALTEIKTSGIADDAVTTDKLANAINTERTANTAKSTNATHTGEVTGSGALTITDDTVDEANLKISNAGSNGQFLQKQSGNTGGLTWATPTDTNTVTTIVNNASGRLIVGSGTANTLDAKSTGTYNGTKLFLSGGSGSDGHIPMLELKHLNTASSGGDGDGPALLLNGYYSSNEWALAKIAATNAGGAYGAGYAGSLEFWVHPANGTQTASVIKGAEIIGDNDGANLYINNGNLVVGTAGHGIDFSATSGTGTSELFDDYEEGTYTISDASGNGITYTANSTTKYVKIGQLVFVQFDVTLSNCNNATTEDSKFSLPFALAHDYGSGVVGWNDLDRQITLHVASSGAMLMDNSQTGNASRHLKNSELNNERFIGNFHYLAAT